MKEQPQPTCTAIIPVFNEETAIDSAIERTKKAFLSVPNLTWQIICVDDGSKDKTAERLARQNDAIVLSHRNNLGYGAALQTGVIRGEHEWVFIVDADGTYPIEDYPRLWREITPQTDMIVGARQGLGITHNPFRRLGRWILKRIVQALTGTYVPDLNSGMRLFRRKLCLEHLHLLPRGFSFTTTLTVAALYSGSTVKYVPIDYGRRQGRSNIRPVSDFLGFLMIIVRLTSYFEPLRFFLPLAFVFAGLGCTRILRDIIVTDGIGSLAMLLMAIALNIFFTGVILDVLVRRLLWVKIPNTTTDASGRNPNPGPLP